MKSKLFLRILILFSFLTVGCSSTPSSLSTEASYSQNNSVESVQTKSEKKYISDQLLDAVRADLGPSPQPGSKDQKSDEKILYSWQKKRTAKDCAAAETEVVVTVKSFFQIPQGPLSETEISQSEKLLEEVRRLTGQYIGLSKRDFNRPRPYTYIKNLKPCVALESSLAYPSGHATLAELWSLVLSDLWPQKSKVLQQRADQIALHRVMAGVHHPSDIEAGKKLARFIYRELQKSDEYKKDLKSVLENIK